MEIHNLYSIDIFLQGMFLLLCAFIGLYIVFNDNLENFKHSDTVNKLSDNFHTLAMNIAGVFSLGPNSESPKNENEEKNSKNGQFKALGIIPIVIILSFILGILGHSIADIWIDSDRKKHTYLKHLWADELIAFDKDIKQQNGKKYNADLATPYKKLVRYKAFKDVFGDTLPKKPSTRIIEQLYFHSKHQIIQDSSYSAYVRKSQTMAEYSRVFALGFFFLVLCGFINLIIMTCRTPFENWENDEEQSNDNTATNSEEPHKNEPEVPTDKETENIGTKYVPDFVIFIFNIISLLAIYFFSKPVFENFENPWLGILMRILVYFGCFTFLLNIFPKYRVLRFSFFMYSILYVVSLLGYFASAKIWIASERQVALKVFGIYKSINISPHIKEIEYAKKTLKLDVYEIEDSLRGKSQIEEEDSIFKNR